MQATAVRDRDDVAANFPLRELDWSGRAEWSRNGSPAEYPAVEA